MLALRASFASLQRRCRAARFSATLTCNWCEALEIFHYFAQIVRRKLELINKGENRDDFHQVQGKYQRISFTEFLSCFFQVEFIPRGEGGAFGQNIYPCQLDSK